MNTELLNGFERTENKRYFDSIIMDKMYHTLTLFLYICLMDHVTDVQTELIKGI